MAAIWRHVLEINCCEVSTSWFSPLIITPVASFTKEVNSRLVKHPLVFNGRLANRGLTSLVKEATGLPWYPTTSLRHLDGWRYITAESDPGGWFNINMSSYQHRKSHCGDKTILRPSTMGFPILIRWHLYIETGPRPSATTILILIYSTITWIILQRNTLMA